MGFGGEAFRQYVLPPLEGKESPEIPVFPGISPTEQLIFDIVAKASELLPTDGLNEQIVQTRGEPYSLSTISNAVSAFNRRETGYRIENTAGRGRGVKATWAVKRVREADKKIGQNAKSDEQKKDKDNLPNNPPKAVTEEEPFTTRETFPGFTEKAAVRIGESQLLPNGDEIFPARVGAVIYQARKIGGNKRRISMIHYKPLSKTQKESE